MGHAAAFTEISSELAVVHGSGILGLPDDRVVWVLGERVSVPVGLAVYVRLTSLNPGARTARGSRGHHFGASVFLVGRSLRWQRSYGPTVTFGSVGYRFVRYATRGVEWVRRGPPDSPLVGLSRRCSDARRGRKLAGCPWSSTVSVFLLAGLTPSAASAMRTVSRGGHVPYRTHRKRRADCPANEPEHDPGRARPFRM